MLQSMGLQSVGQNLDWSTSNDIDIKHIINNNVYDYVPGLS